MGSEALLVSSGLSDVEERTRTDFVEIDHSPEEHDWESTSVLQGLRGTLTGLQDVRDRFLASRQITIDDLRMFLQYPNDTLEDERKVFFSMLSISLQSAFKGFRLASLDTKYLNAFSSFPSPISP